MSNYFCLGIRAFLETLQRMPDRQRRCQEEVAPSVSCLKAKIVTWSLWNSECLKMFDMSRTSCAIKFVCRTSIGKALESHDHSVYVSFCVSGTFFRTMPLVRRYTDVSCWQNISAYLIIFKDHLCKSPSTCKKKKKETERKIKLNQINHTKKYS